MTPPDIAAALAAIRSALKGARGLALDSGEVDLDTELGRAIDLLDEVVNLAEPLWRGAKAEPASSLGERMDHVHVASQALLDALADLDADVLLELANR